MSRAIGSRLSVVGVMLGAPLAAQQIPPLPDSSGWGVHVLALARAPDSSIWAGTYGQGIFVLRPGAGAWERIRSSGDTATHAISWDFVHAFAFGSQGEIWYATVGNGWGLSTDGGKTWRNWEFGQLGPEWQYVAPNGIVTRGDTVYIATADGIKLTWDNGATWRVITDAAGVTTTRDSILGSITNQYVLSIARGPDGQIWVSNLRDLAVSTDGGRSWRAISQPPCKARRPICPIRSMVAVEGGLLAATAEDLFGGGEGPRAWEWQQLSGIAVDDSLVERVLLAPLARSFFPNSRTFSDGTVEPPRHTWFRRPISLHDQPYIDQTYRFGSTMGGNFQPHQGVEFNNPNGTPVHAIGDGEVVWAGPAERGALTVAIRHSRKVTADSRQPLFLFSVYYHNSKLLVSVGQQVKVGHVIAQVGNTGRATNDHLHLEVHAAPTDSVRYIVDPEVRYPPFNTNPELWIDPLPGTGLIAGQVWDANGQPVQQARIYGLVKPQPQETPFSFIETYGPRNHSDPVYHEHFAISDVPPGEYVLGVEIEGKRVYRRVRVEPRKLTWVEFRPEAPQ
jgi:murein DD-endopeptidase MepM/ murein hydrolase activator NlpD